MTFSIIAGLRAFQNPLILQEDSRRSAHPTRYWTEWEGSGHEPLLAAGVAASRNKVHYDE
jgi:hypothetical protein